MKLSEMENHHDRFLECEKDIARMVRDRCFSTVFQSCLGSFEHIVPAISFRKRKEIEPSDAPLLPLTTICQFAPPLFEHAVLVAAVEFVRSTRVIARHDQNYLAAFEAAFHLEESARRVWNYIDKTPAVSPQTIGQEVGIASDEAASILAVWETLGILVRRRLQNDDRLFLQSRLNTETEGVCMNCGVTGRAKKEVFFVFTKCKQCGSHGYFYIKSTVSF